MSEISRILDQMDRAMAGEAWHGPALNPLFEGITAEQASMHPVRGAHSIWEIVNHLGAWNRIVHRRFAGTPVDVTPEMDWPPVWEVSEVEWRRSLDNLWESRAQFRAAVAQVRDEELAAPPAGTEWSRYATLHGVVQHDLYHAGQIAILKKRSVDGEQDGMGGTAARPFAGEIRPARPDDYPQMAELAGQLGYPSSADDVARRLAGLNATGEHVVFVAQLADGAVAGWIGAFVYRCVEADARVEISGLVVDERFRSQAVGRVLLERAEAWAREQGYTATSLRSNVIRERAHAFYERQGYEHTKTQKSFRKKL